MDKIKKYIAIFFKNKEMNCNYDMRILDFMALANSEQSKCDVIETTFNFGYAKGYRAAMAEIKKGSVA